MPDETPPTPHAWRPTRFMVIVAHPDDADFGPAATAARWIDEGSTGWLVCCTSGDAGNDDWRTDPLELGALRETEQQAAADVVGYAGVSFLHQPDGALANDLALRELLVREIRTFRPDAVLTIDPETIFHDDGGVNHIDHRDGGDGRGRRRLPGGPQRDGVPVARARRPRAVDGPPPVPVVVQQAHARGWTSRRASTARSPPCARTRARSRSPTRSRAGSASGPATRASRSASRRPRRTA